tara:strand:+ start:3605 stop:4087 length:483 start_codon:yes stop_codon:yes gene_type:complete
MPSAGDNLSLGKLGRAVGHSSDYTTQTSLAGNCGGANSQTAFSDFDGGTFSSVGLSPSTTAGGSVTATANFTSPGGKFLSRIGNRYQNFTWSEDSDTYNVVSINSNQDYTATISVASGPPILDTITIRCTFKEGGATDGFNDHITGYNTVKTATLTYDPS